MEVITLDDKDFTDRCRQLRELVEGAGFRPDAVVAIASGGIGVAQAMGYDTFADITLRRKGNTLKRKFADRIVRHLPRRLNDALRMAESGVRRLLRHRSESTEPLALTPGLVGRLSGCRNILIVDDSVDTGRTLRRVSTALTDAFPEATVRTAVITVTQPDPMIRPDWSLYDNGTLLRFPWAPDFKRPHHD